MSVEQVSERATGYGIPGVTVDGQDVLAVHAAVSSPTAPLPHPLRPASAGR